MKLEVRITFDSVQVHEAPTLEREIKDRLNEQSLSTYSFVSTLIPEPPVDFHQSEPEE